MSGGGRDQEGEAACRLATEKLGATESTAGLRVLAKTLAWQATFNRKSTIEQADQLLQKSLSLLDSPELTDQKDTRPEKAFVLRQMGLIAASYDPEKARPLYEQSLAWYQALGDQWGTANVLDVLGWVFQHTGDNDKAKQLHEKSLALRQVLGDQRGIANLLFALAFNATTQAQFEEAERLAREHLATLQEIGDRASLGRGLLNLGQILIRVGKFAEGHARLEESQSIYEDLSLRGPIAYSNIWLGWTKAHLGRYDPAHVQIQMGLIQAREIGDKGYIRVGLRYLGRVFMAKKAYAEAQELLMENVTRWR